MQHDCGMMSAFEGKNAHNWFDIDLLGRAVGRGAMNQHSAVETSSERTQAGCRIFVGWLLLVGTMSFGETSRPTTKAEAGPYAANRIVVLLDATASMAGNYDGVEVVLRTALWDLKSVDSQFTIIAFNGNGYRRLSSQLLPFDSKSRSKMDEFLEKLKFDGSDDYFSAAVATALEEKPDLVVLLSSDAVSASSVAVSFGDDFRTRKIPIWAVCLGHGDSAVLRKLAERSGGSYGNNAIPVQIAQANGAAVSHQHGTVDAAATATPSPDEVDAVALESPARPVAEGAVPPEAHRNIMISAKDGNRSTRLSLGPLQRGQVLKFQYVSGKWTAYPGAKYPPASPDDVPVAHENVVAVRLCERRGKDLVELAVLPGGTKATPFVFTAPRDIAELIVNNTDARPANNTGEVTYSVGGLVAAGK